MQEMPRKQWNKMANRIRSKTLVGTESKGRWWIKQLKNASWEASKDFGKQQHSSGEWRGEGRDRWWNKTKENI